MYKIWLLENTFLSAKMTRMWGQSKLQDGCTQDLFCTCQGLTGVCDHSNAILGSRKSR